MKSAILHRSHSPMSSITRLEPRLVLSGGVDFETSVQPDGAIDLTITRETLTGHGATVEIDLTGSLASTFSFAGGLRSATIEFSNGQRSAKLSVQPAATFTENSIAGADLLLIGGLRNSLHDEVAVVNFAGKVAVDGTRNPWTPPTQYPEFSSGSGQWWQGKDVTYYPRLEPGTTTPNGGALGAVTGDNSQILTGEMEKDAHDKARRDEIKAADPNAEINSHHIVAAGRNRPDAARSREVLTKYEISINGAENGVCVTKAVHDTLHRSETEQIIRTILDDAEEAAAAEADEKNLSDAQRKAHIRKRIIEALERIQAQIEAGESLDIDNDGFPDFDATIQDPNPDPDENPTGGASPPTGNSSNPLM
jgi:hypothetical protein